MKFLLNMNVPRDLGKLLTTKGHDCRHVGDIGMAQASDLEIIKEARANKEMIITHDLDYGYLLAEGIAADYDSDGRLAGIEILDAVKRLGDPQVFRQVIMEDIALGRQELQST